MRNWPSESVAIRYRVTCHGNDVYRIDDAEVLGAAPMPDGEEVTLIGPETMHLHDALDALGVVGRSAWACFATYAGPVSTIFTAWSI